MFDEIDQETLNLIIEIQLQDAKNLIRGKHRDGEQPDTELAMQLYCRELESLATIRSDHAMGRSMAHAVLLDGDTIRSHLEEEQQAARDREYAINGEPSAAVSGTATPDTVIEDEMIKKLAALYIGFDDEEYPTAGESSSAQAKRTSKSASASLRRRCLACTADVPFFEMVQCPCSHEYCRGCIAELFKAAMSDESLFPPRCCGQSIPLGINQIFLTAELVGEYRAKELEYNTPNRTYCHQPTCSAFIPLQFIQGDTAICIKCRSETCTICKGPSHDDHCPEDMATLDVLRIASENGWQRCYSCRRVVDLSTGCNHITCRCGAQFCYVCGLQWKTCTCDQWDENRLIDRANVLVDRDAEGHQLGRAQRAALVERARHDLVQNHQCLHQRWRSRRGAFRCDECHDRMPDYIYECRDCRILGCRRCRYNRL
ncbi:uncharacterized protein TRIVIDRAFT_159594 [Trichoderma virens Gv29-8]|uniref:RBR-type E3 ubiquitin transferase n=1 Tax=Hypocrea virens (strain Gv29-8 / FGSC 10586) TaxID=413071 RepID=G9N652_HYPVG|nr:uncharacterized protein TRIVIDRAFT_159594 [Trichoderma virens Gv29-8]EHK18242.1 hypothetical protein TRIVIDRAFT_159594 [Trichoderma virens Gv29-8]